MNFFSLFVALCCSLVFAQDFAEDSGFEFITEGRCPSDTAIWKKRSLCLEAARALGKTKVKVVKKKYATMAPAGCYQKASNGRVYYNAFNPDYKTEDEDGNMVLANTVTASAEKPLICGLGSSSKSESTRDTSGTGSSSGSETRPLSAWEESEKKKDEEVANQRCNNDSGNLMKDGSCCSDAQSLFDDWTKPPVRCCGAGMVAAMDGKTCTYTSAPEARVGDAAACEFAAKRLCKIMSWYKTNCPTLCAEPVPTESPKRNELLESIRNYDSEDPEKQVGGAGCYECSCCTTDFCQRAYCNDRAAQETGVSDMATQFEERDDIKPSADKEQYCWGGWAHNQYIVGWPKTDVYRCTKPWECNLAQAMDACKEVGKACGGIVENTSGNNGNWYTIRGRHGSNPNYMGGLLIAGNSEFENYMPYNPDDSWCPHGKSESLLAVNRALKKALQAALN